MSAAQDCELKVTSKSHKIWFDSRHLLYLCCEIRASRQLTDWGEAREAGTAGPGFHR